MSTRHEFVRTLLEISNICERGGEESLVLEHREVCWGLCRNFDVVEAYSVVDPCGVHGVVELVAELLGDDAPPALLALAARLMAADDNGPRPASAQDQMDRARSAYRARRARGWAKHWAVGDVGLTRHGDVLAVFDVREEMIAVYPPEQNPSCGWWCHASDIRRPDDQELRDLRRSLLQRAAAMQSALADRARKTGG